MAYTSENAVLLYHELNTIIGNENTLKILRTYHGRQIYFPESLLREFRDRSIREDFRNGMSYKDLARKYALTEKHIRHITAPKKQGKTQKNQPPLEGQRGVSPSKKSPKAQELFTFSP